MNLGKRIAQARRDKGLTQAVLARRTGISQSFLSRIENDRREVDAALVGRLARDLGLEVGPLEVEPPRALMPASKVLLPERIRCPMRRSEISLATRWNQARLTLGRDFVGALLKAMSRRLEKPVWDKVLSRISVDSSLEIVYAVRLLLDRAFFTKVRVLKLGFRLPVIDPITKLTTGDCPRWALVVQEEEVTIVLVPYVTVLLPKMPPIRLDFLGIAQVGAGRWCLDLEVDGPQHKETQIQDQEREGALQLPTYRISFEELGKQDLRGDLIEWVKLLPNQNRGRAGLRQPWL